MRGISEDRLVEKLGYTDQPSYEDLLCELIDECQELQEPWMTLDEFLGSGFIGECWICNHNKAIAAAYYHGYFYQSITSSVMVSAFDIYRVMPIHKPEPPK